MRRLLSISAIAAIAVMACTVTASAATQAQAKRAAKKYMQFKPAFKVKSITCTRTRCTVKAAIQETGGSCTGRLKIQHRIGLIEAVAIRKPGSCWNRVRDPGQLPPPGAAPPSTGGGASRVLGKTFTALTLEAFYGNGQTVFTGGAVSVKKACANKRLVTVYRKRPGADPKVGKARSTSGLTAPGLYFYALAKDGAQPFGTYYAVAKATDKCKAARSIDHRGPG